MAMLDMVMVLLLVLVPLLVLGMVLLLVLVIILLLGMTRNQSLVGVTKDNQDLNKGLVAAEILL